MANRLANKSALKLGWFKNPSGKKVPRVSGTLPSGERIRQNFKTELEAQVFINSKVRGLVTQHTSRTLTTHLSERTVRLCEAALTRLPAGTDIAQAVDFFAEHHRPLTPVAIAVAIEGFGEWLRTQRKNEDITIDTRKTVLTSFARDHEVDRSDRITVEKAKAWIYSKDVEVRTQRDRFDLINWFCAHLVSAKRAAFNPIAEFAGDRPVVKVDVPGVFTFLEVWTLLMCALTDSEGPDMLPFFAICCLSGVRPDEVPRLCPVDPEDEKPDHWADIHLEEEHRFIEVNKAKGGRSRRNATIGDALWRILTWCKAQGLHPNYFSKRKFDRIRRRAGLYKRWEKDVCRHSYASHVYIVTKDVKQLEADMGNSERVLFQNYIRPVPKLEGIRYQGIVLHYSAPKLPSQHHGGRVFPPKWKRPLKKSAA